MPKGIKRKKTVAREKKSSKKEFDIPVYVVSNLKKKQKFEAEITNKNSQEDIFLNQAEANSLRTVPDFAKSHYLESDFKLPEVNLGEPKIIQPVLERARPTEPFSKVENLSAEKRKTLMWVLIVVLTGFIFLGWLSILKHSLFAQSSKNEENIFAGIKQDLVDFPEFWQEKDFPNSASVLNEEKINKLKTKVLEAANEKNNLNQENTTE